MQVSTLVVLMVRAGEILKCTRGTRIQPGSTFPFSIFLWVANEPLVVSEPAAFTEMQIFQGLHYSFFMHILFSLEMRN